MKLSRSLTYVYTEQVVAMLSAVFHTPKAVAISVKIMYAFVTMRRFLASNTQVFQRLAAVTSLYARRGALAKQNAAVGPKGQQAVLAFGHSES